MNHMYTVEEIIVLLQQVQKMGIDVDELPGSMTIEELQKLVDGEDYN